jgi:hypothetical protein
MSSAISYGSVLLKERKEGDGYEGVLDVPLASLVNFILLLWWY